MILMALTALIIVWNDLNVQDHWNALELVILDGVDSCASLVDARLGATGRKSKIPSSRL